MHSEDYDGANAQERVGEDVYSKPVRAGKRTYFFDVKATKGSDYYLTITESKRKVERDGRFAYDKHKIFLYKEDFEKFSTGLAEVIEYIKHNCLKDEDISVTPPKKDSFTDVDFEEL
ncbi:MAG: PUR family DNA/RNA-binding protein [Bacteroidales bacterium]|nr:PUR family DNA/RNA-binding protein [Bacteroidales bacterium]